MSTLRKGTFLRLRKSTGFRQVDHVGFWYTTISLIREAYVRARASCHYPTRAVGRVRVDAAEGAPRAARARPAPPSSPGSLEHEPDGLRLDLLWDELQEGRDLLILDEAQTWPAIFPRLRTAIDRHRSRRSRFLLLGSVSPALMRGVSESLAGRMSLIELTPFLFNEAPATSLTRLWRRGGFPDGGILGQQRYPNWQRDYVTLLAQRDLPAWGLPAKPQATLRLMRMLAALNAQVWNASQVGQSLGLSYHTVNSYLDFLTGAYLIRRLAPYAASLGARLTKSPKVYWRDSGLLHSLLGATDDDSFLSQPWLGASWEGFVIEQVLGLFEQRGLEAGAGAAMERDP